MKMVKARTEPRGGSRAPGGCRELTERRGRWRRPGRLLSFAELESCLAGKRATVDWPARHAGGYIVENGPPEALDTFLRYMADTGDQELALRRAMQMPLDVIEKRWRSDTRKYYMSRGVPLTVELVIFGAMLLVFLVVIVVRLRRSKEIRERMQEEERLRSLFSGMDDDDLMTVPEWHQ